MEIKEKYRIVWKNEFKKDNKTTHIKRYLFLLELFMFTNKPKDYNQYHKYRAVQEYIDFTNTDIFLSEEYDRTFLQTQKYEKKQKIKLIQNYRKNIELPIKKLTNWIWSLKFVGVLTFLYGCLFFLPINNVVIHDTSFYSFLVGIVCFLSRDFFSLYIKGKLNFVFLTKLLFMRPFAFIENLEYEKSCIDNYYYDLYNWKEFKIFTEFIPEAKKYFEVLIDYGCIEVKDKTIKYIYPCTQQVFAEILKDPVFIFCNKKVSRDIFKKIFNKTLNGMEQRYNKIYETKEYEVVKKILLNNSVTINEDFL